MSTRKWVARLSVFVLVVGLGASQVLLGADEKKGAGGVKAGDSVKGGGAAKGDAAKGSDTPKGGDAPKAMKGTQNPFAGKILIVFQEDTEDTDAWGIEDVELTEIGGRLCLVGTGVVVDDDWHSGLKTYIPWDDVTAVVEVADMKAFHERIKLLRAEAAMDDGDDPGDTKADGAKDEAKAETADGDKKDDGDKKEDPAGDDKKDAAPKGKKKAAPAEEDKDK